MIENSTLFGTFQKHVFLEYKGSPMISIERTAYPRLNANRVISEKNLYAAYTLTPQEEDHIKGIIRKNRYQLCYAVQLKAMQNNNFHFPMYIRYTFTGSIPKWLQDQIRTILGLLHKTHI